MAMQAGRWPQVEVRWVAGVEVQMDGPVTRCR